MAAAGALALALAAAQADPGAFFEEKVRPLLAQRCLGCHGAAKVSGLSLESREGILAGGRHGPAIEPGSLEASLLIQAVRRTHAKLRMPPTDPLPAGEVAIFEQWVKMGAPWPAATVTKRTAGSKIKPEDRDWWAFRPLRPPPVAKASATSPIDEFIRAKLDAQGLRAAPLADKRTLIRRVTFDLVGLPPEATDVDRLLADEWPGAFADAVDRLLASPHFGERWGRHWLDIARYGEDDVLGLSQEKYANAWRYRDWVVEALNRDLPYSLFVQAQIAADQMEADAGMDLRPALGLFGLGPWQYTVSPPPQARADERHDRVDMIGRGFLGLTIACARCHDHKFDPITMRDYYAIAGVFGSSEYREYPLAAPEVAEAYDRHQQRIKELDQKIKDFVKARQAEAAEALASRTSALLDPAGASADEPARRRWKNYLSKPEQDHPYLKDASRWTADERAGFERFLVRVMADKKQIDRERDELVERSKPKKGAAKTRLPNGFETYDEFCPGCDIAVRSLPRDEYVLWNDLHRADPKDKPFTGGPLFVSEDELGAFLSAAQKSELEGMRAELDRLKKSTPPAYPYLHGLGDKARIVNLRIHLRGDPYSLGEETPRRFLEVLSPADAEPWTDGSGRLQLAEAVVRQPITARVAANRIWSQLLGRGLVATPSNFGRFGDRPTHPELLDYLAHRLVSGGWSVKKLIREIVLSETYRRSSETVDSSQAADGANKWYWRANRRRLDAEAMRDSQLAAAGLLDPAVGGESGELGPEFRRRTVYGRVSRFELSEMLRLFDFPNPGITSEKRNVTHVPLQRLFFLNNAFAAKVADGMAARLEREAGADVEARVRLAHRILYSRAPSPNEVDLARTFLEQGTWPQLAQVWLASNEFLFVD